MFWYRRHKRVVLQLYKYLKILPMRESFQFQDQFRKLIPEITLENVAPCMVSPANEAWRQPERQLISEISKRTFQRKSTLMADFSTARYLLYAFCLVQNSVMSTITIQMISKRDPDRYAIKQLKSIYLEITALKFALNQFGMLTLLAGSACGRLVVYHDFEAGQAIVEGFRFSSHSVVDFIVPKFGASAFVLTANGTIYVIDLKEKLISYQLQCEIPQIEDNQIYLFIDEAEQLICCAFGYGRIIVWELNSSIKSHIQPARQNDCQVIGDSQSIEANCLRQKRLIKKQGKQRVTRNLIFKPLMNILSCIQEGIKWISFIGTFLALVTHSNTFKLLAVNLSSNGSNCQLYLTIGQFSLVPHINNSTNPPKISEIKKWGTGIIVTMNFYLQNQRQSITSRIERYTFSQRLKTLKVQVIELEGGTGVQQACWDTSGRFVLCRRSGSYSLLQLNETEV